MTFYEKALGDGRKEKLPFNRKKLQQNHLKSKDKQFRLKSEHF